VACRSLGVGCPACLLTLSMCVDCPQASADLRSSKRSSTHGGGKSPPRPLAAHVVGYSAKMGADDADTLARVRTLRTAVIEPLAATHGGRLFKSMGDGFLVEFPSAVQALRCAIAIQSALNAQAAGLRLRIGVHQGEVVAEGDDLFGDGVIVAARLEPLAENGGIVISSRVKEDASGKIPLEVDDLGEPPLKNIAARVRVYRVRTGGTGMAASSAPGSANPPSSCCPLPT
jgi:adenylate cyclase